MFASHNFKQILNLNKKQILLNEICSDLQKPFQETFVNSLCRPSRPYICLGKARSQIQRCRDIRVDQIEVTGQSLVQISEIKRGNSHDGLSGKERPFDYESKNREHLASLGSQNIVQHDWRTEMLAIKLMDFENSFSYRPKIQDPRITVEKVL